MLVSHKHKLVIFTLERTASKSIHFALKPHFDVCIDTPPYKHCTADTFKYLIEPLLPERYYKCAVVRDPIQRCMSLYSCVQNTADVQLKFADWWRPYYMETKCPWLSQKDSLSTNNNLYVDRLFDFSQINLFCQFISNTLGISFELPKLNYSKCTAIVSKEVSDQVRSMLHDDIILYKSIVDAGGELIINPYRSTP